MLFGLQNIVAIDTSDCLFFSWLSMFYLPLTVSETLTYEALILLFFVEMQWVLLDIGKQITGV